MQQANSDLNMTDKFGFKPAWSHAPELGDRVRVHDGGTSVEIVVRRVDTLEGKWSAWGEPDWDTLEWKDDA